MTPDQLELLRALLQPARTDPDRLVPAAADLLVRDEGVSIEVTNALGRFLRSPHERELSLVQKEIVATLPWDLGATLLIDTITRLTTGGYIEHEQAADLLAATPYAVRKELSPQASSLVEVAEAVAHDLAEGLMNISDDDRRRSLDYRVWTE